MDENFHVSRSSYIHVSSSSLVSKPLIDKQWLAAPPPGISNINVCAYNNVPCTVRVLQKVMYICLSHLPLKHRVLHWQPFLSFLCKLYDRHLGRIHLPVQELLGLCRSLLKKRNISKYGIAAV